MYWLDAFNELRKRSGLSLDEISRKSGVPKGTLSKITSGITKNPSIETMKTLVHTIGYTLDDLDPKGKKQSQLVSADELSRIKKYRTLDEHGKDVVDVVLDKEYERMLSKRQPISIAARGGDTVQGYVDGTDEELEQILKECEQTTNL